MATGIDPFPTVDASVNTRMAASCDQTLYFVSRYRHKMSHYCDHCHYHHGEKPGRGPVRSTVFYWKFLVRHKARAYRTHLNDL